MEKIKDYRTLILMLAKKCPNCDIENPPDCALCEIRKGNVRERYEKIIDLSDNELKLLVEKHDCCTRNEIGDLKEIFKFFHC